MTNETRNRIRAYMEELPHMKEKVFGALLMLVIAATVVVASSYAWVTLSRAPEVTDITTTLAANGALEIALSNPDGTAPAEFDIDESLPDNPSVVVSNLQWGNLVNLSDPTYGIDNIALRPAKLNEANLLYNPLQGATYGEDGRITELNINYTYTMFDGKQFVASSKYGVRAISSYITTTSDTTTITIGEMTKQVYNELEDVARLYGDVVDNFKYLGDLITRVAQDKVNATEYRPDGETSTDSNLASHLSDMRDLYVLIEKAMSAQKEAYVALANLQLYQWAKANEQEFAATNWANLESKHGDYNAADSATPSKDGRISLTGLTQFILDYNALVKDLSYLEKYVAAYVANNGVAYYWSHGGDSGYNIVDMVNRLIDYTSMYLIIDNEEVPLGKIQNRATDLLGGGTYPIYTKKGILKNFEQGVLRSDDRMNGEASCDIVITAQKSIVKLDVEVRGQAYTTAEGTSYFERDLTATQNKTMDAADKIAEDTYGLAVDLWVRTNAETTCLTLEGATSTDEQGNIVSYDGINRVWGATGEASLTTNSTTQGGGSCYIYYADTPEDMARSLELLNSMKVAFVSDDGELLATAEMDTAHPWAVNGRVTVPLVLGKTTKTTYSYVDDKNLEQTGYAITTLYTDQAMRITAIVYLEGTHLTNDHVLAAAEIEGTLNIQFGSSTNLKTIGSNDLIDDTRSVTAESDKYEMDYDTAVAGTDDLTATVTLRVDGTQPERITAFFVRAINSTQGAREKELPFTRLDDGTWTCSHTFVAPGTYYLRHVRLDGVDYALDEPLMIEVKGFALSNVTWSLGDAASHTVRTSDNTYSVDVAATFASTDPNKMPETVNIRFLRDDGNAVNVPLTYSSSRGQWIGTAKFAVSGTYTMEYAVYTIRGETTSHYKDLGDFKKELNLSLGMYVTVTDKSGGLEGEYDEDALKANKEIYYKNVEVHVYDNGGNELKDLTGLRLYYSNSDDMTNTINTDLAWTGLELNGSYTGTLPIAAPGQYQFAWVQVGDQYLFKCTDSPTYTLISPDPPIYDASSKCEENNVAGVQLVPFSNDARISGLIIENAGAAKMSVVVYSEVTQEYYVLSKEDGEVSVSGNSWSIKLPTYTLDLDEDGEPTPDAKYIQDGKWSLVAVKLSGCYDAGGVLRKDDNPIIWSGSDSISQSWLSDQGLEADASYDFGAMDTTVSSSVVVTMTVAEDPVLGYTDMALGDADTKFMTQFYLNDTKELKALHVEIKDEDGNRIPNEKIVEGSVKLSISYTPPTTDEDGEKYGYTVLNKDNAAQNAYSYTDIVLGYNSSEGWYEITDGRFWQYVGEYTVESLTVTFSGTTPITKNYEPKNSDGSDVVFTVTTKGPGAGDVIMTVNQGSDNLLGKSGDNVIGTFLQSYGLNNTYARFGLSGMTNHYVDLSKIVKNVSLQLTYLDGKTAPNGGYSWTDTSQYESISLSMTPDTDGVYRHGSTPLLAGTYSAKIVATIGDEAKEEALENVVVHSKLPDVTMALASGTPTNVVASTTGLAYAVDSSLTFEGTNTVVDEGHSAVVYMQYEIGVDAWHSDDCGSQNETPPKVNSYANYTKPTLTFTLSDLGEAAQKISTTLSIPKNQETAKWISNSTETAATAGIGAVTTENKNDGNHGYGLLNAFICNYMYGTESVTVIGEQTVKTVTSTDNKGIEYVRTLATPLSIVQNNTAVPSLTFLSVEEPFVTPANQYSDDGRSFTYTLPTVYTASGAASVISAVEHVTGQVITGADVTSQLPTIDAVVSDDSAWSADGAESPLGEYLVRSETPGTGESHYYWRHGGWGFATYYYYTVTQTLYDRYAVNQKALQTITVENATISTVTNYDTFNAVRELDYWLIGDTRYEPGQTITVSGNLQARAVFKTTEVKTGTRELTESLTGTALFEYYITCTAEIVKQTKTDTETTTNYCAGSSCGTYTAKGSQTAATNAAAADAAAIADLSTTATKVKSVGTVRSNVSSGWQYNGVVVQNGTSSTTDQYYDLDGNPIPNPNP